MSADMGIYIISHAVGHISLLYNKNIALRSNISPNSDFSSSWIEAQPKAFPLRGRGTALAVDEVFCDVLTPHQSKIRDFCQLLLKEKPLVQI